ncbi:DUF3488 domain-containing protein [Aggregicoccus sp. 17bor-14]|uniref:transglutaminase TgpA family protein n=1 Tax=Myxococcaceae TaxID=31 RepID=UPI00129C6889|nr:MULTISPECIES: DUF3488 and transglutaminase-like domain-containing protein [Myxococcaceae]MBF5044041.1 DUF3488 domain-containing protein [Simulacricoccus sp. 17bor-14]MRI89792.1 DUF3488 domain-containing protein [Aggregicoccus sp. 17bor-14]
MRPPTRLRLRLRDLGCGAGFGAMAVSGQLPAWTLGVFGLSLLLALLGRRVLGQRTLASALLLLGSAAMLYVQVTREGLDPVVAASAFAALVAAQRLLSTPSPATDGHVHLVGLLMIAGGAALSGDLPFALCLIAFTVLSCLSMGLSAIEAVVPEEERVPVREALGPLSVGVLFAVLGAITFFILFPRVSWNMASRRGSAGLGVATAGFADKVRLGGSGTIKSNPRVVLRAQLTPDPGADTLNAHWLGRTFDTFDGTEWSSVGEPLPPRQVVTLRRGGEGLVHQRLELLPAYGARTLIALETPARLGNGYTVSGADRQRLGLVRVGTSEVRFATDGSGFFYEAYSMPGEAAPVPDAMSIPERDQLLALPMGLDPRVGALAEKVLAGEQDPLRAAHKLEAFLQREYRYTLELGGDVEDPLADFLFGRKEGHCEHFATALTIMLRTQGIAARLATGFYGGERVQDGYIVRAGDAHAWTHVLVPGQGFVTVDPTPPDYRAAQPLAVLEALVTLYERMENLWRAAVVDYSFRDQMQLASALVRPPRERGPEGARGQVPLPPARAWAAALAVGLAVYATWRFATRARQRTRPLDATRFLEAVERRLARAGVRPQPQEPLERLGARLEAEGHPLGPALRPVARRYLEARFGGRPLQEGEAARLLATLAHPPPRKGPPPSPGPRAP